MTDLKFEAPTNEPIVIMTRTLHAPRALVWKAISEPQHLVRWFGPHAHENRVVTFDWRVGGKWKIETTIAGEHVVMFHGEYIEIAPIEKTVQTFGIEGMYDGQFSIDTLTLEDLGDETLYKTVSRLPDVASRDGMMASGMETGVVEGFERLDAMLEEFKSGTY